VGTVATVLTEADVAYIRANFVPLDRLAGERGESLADVRALAQQGGLPRPSYVLEDGTEMVPADYFALADEAGGVANLREAFAERYVRAAAAERAPLATAEQEWRAYLSGEYGVCLRHVTPETIVRKSTLMHEIEGLLAEARPADEPWQASLRRAVDDLDELERPFAPHYDRARFGAPSSRDKLITAVRKTYPAVFAEPAPVRAS
jgi:hypothetical protein